MNPTAQTQRKDQAALAPDYWRTRGGLLQRKCACGQQTIAGGECEECKKNRLGLQRKEADRSELSEVPPIVHEVLSSPGQPIDPATRAFFEPRFGQDFSQVRVHTDTKAADSAQAVNALAYTVGSNIVFASDAHAPMTLSGRELLAHELAHTVQQKSAGSAHSPGVQIAPANSSDEAEADRAAQQAVSGHSLEGQSMSPAFSPVLQRQERPREREPLIPRIPIPVFDELDPFVMAPDIPGVPDFLRGQKVKLSTLRSALEILRGGRLPLPDAGGGDICSQLLPGHERVSSGEFAGLCCPRFRRGRDICCLPQRIGLMSFRCCTPDEVIINDRCVRPPPAPLPPAIPSPTPTENRPSLPTLPRLELHTQPIRFGTIQSLTIDHFALDSDRLPVAASAQMDRLASQLKLYREVEVHLEGHTDSSFTDTYNQGLSERRARAVRDALVQRGIDASRLVLTGFGESRLLFPEERDEEEKARNRRVEVWFHIPPARTLGEEFQLQRPSLPIR